MSFMLWLLVWFCPLFMVPSTKLEKMGKIGEFLARLFLSLVIVLFLSPLYYEFPSVDATVVTFDGGRVVKHLYGTLCWEFSNTWANMPDETRISGVVVPITDNPKARRIVYNVTLTFSAPEKFYMPTKHSSGHYSTNRSKVTPNTGTDYRYQFKLKHDAFKDFILGNGEGVYAEMAQLAYFQLYEFNNFCSKQVAEFYNPLNQEQNKKFKELLEGYVNPRLEPNGLKIIFEDFEVQ